MFLLPIPPPPPHHFKGGGGSFNQERNQAMVGPDKDQDLDRELDNKLKLSKVRNIYMVFPKKVPFRILA